MVMALSMRFSKKDPADTLTGSTENDIIDGLNDDNLIGGACGDMLIGGAVMML